MTDRDRRVAIGAAMEAGFDGYLPRLERRRTVCDLPAIESIEFCEDEGRALVSLVVPFSEVTALLSPLTLEMVEKAFMDWVEAVNRDREKLSEERYAQHLVEWAWSGIRKRLRQQMGGGQG